MRPARNSTIIDSGFGNWHSPIPYLFSGLALLLGLIAMALLILSCSYLQSSHSDASAANEAEEKTTKAAGDGEADSEPKIVVIMAGDDNPTFFAKPALSSTQTRQKS